VNHRVQVSNIEFPFQPAEKLPKVGQLAAPAGNREGKVHRRRHDLIKVFLHAPHRNHIALAVQVVVVHRLVAMDEIVLQTLGRLLLRVAAFYVDVNGALSFTYPTAETVWATQEISLLA